MAAPQFDQFNLVTSDMEAAVAFYRLLGVEVPDMAPEWQAWTLHHRNTEGQEAASFDIDSQAFAKVWNRGWRGGSGVLTFRTQTREEVDEIYARLTGAGYESQQEPYDAFFGCRFAVVTDPDGNAVGLMSQRDEAFRSEGPDPATF